MRVKGSMGNKTLHILLDTSSSHNFLSDKFLRSQSSMVKVIQPFQVTVDDGGKVRVLK